MKVKELVDRFEQFAPKKLAMEKDPVGLQIGSLNSEVHKVMTTLDVRPEVVDEAIENGVDFIFAHHPVMFHPARNLDLDNPQNAMYANIIAHHITVYAAHTNLDSADGGMNDWLAETLRLNNLSGMVPAYDESVFRLTVQVAKWPTINGICHIGPKVFNVKVIGTGSNFLVGSKGNFNVTVFDVWVLLKIFNR